MYLYCILFIFMSDTHRDYQVLPQLQYKRFGGGLSKAAKIWLGSIRKGFLQSPWLHVQTTNSTSWASVDFCFLCLMC